MDEDSNVPLILGSPFLATARTLNDVHDGKVTLRVNDEAVTLDILNHMEHIKLLQLVQVKKTNVFKREEKVMPSKSQLKKFPLRLGPKWKGPFVVKHVCGGGLYKIEGYDGNKLTVNGRTLKHYDEVPIGGREDQTIYRDMPEE